MASGKTTVKTTEKSVEKVAQPKKVKIESKGKTIEIVENKKSSSKKNKQEEEPIVEIIEKQQTELKFIAQYQTVTDLLKKFKEQYQMLSTEVKKLESSYTYDVKKVKKQKHKRTGDYKPTGFTKPQVVSSKLAKFIGEKSGIELTGPQITKKVWEQLRTRNLFYEKDKRVFRTNDEVSAIFGVPDSVNKSISHRDEHGFNFCNLQKYIANALKA